MAKPTRSRSPMRNISSRACRASRAGRRWRRSPPPVAPERPSPRSRSRVYAVGEGDAPQLPLRSRDWDEALALMQERRLPGLNASGQMTDAVLERLSRLEHVTALDLSGSQAADRRRPPASGASAAASTPEPVRCGDHRRGLAVLRRLPSARRLLELAWTRRHRRWRGAPRARASAWSASISRARRPATAPFARWRASASCAISDPATRDRCGPAAPARFAGVQDLAGRRGRAWRCSLRRRPNFLFLRGSFTDAGPGAASRVSTACSR